MPIQIAIILVIILFLYLISSLVFPIAMGAVFSVLLTPGLRFLEKKKVPTSLGAFVLTITVTLLLLLPMLFLILFAARTGFQQLQAWHFNQSYSEGGFFESLMNFPKVKLWINSLLSKIPFQASELMGVFQEVARSVGAWGAELFGEVLTQLPGLMLSLGIMVISVYFFLADGKKILFFLKQNSFFSPEHTEQLIKTVGDMCRSVILASLVSGMVQALFEVIMCILTSTPHLALIGLLVFIGSFIPVVGSSPITVIVAIQQFLEGRKEAGIFLLITAIFLIGIDSAVRPLFLRGTVNLHPFLAFIAALGGLHVWGFWGVFLGPIVASLLIVLLQIGLQSFKERKIK